MFTPTELAVQPGRGRVFTSHRRVRANDADTHRRLRLDGMARYLQDVAFDDLNDAGFGQEHAFWVLRRCIIRVIRPAHFDDEVRLRSWCSALSARWCNKRVTIDAGNGALVESEGFWVNVDGATGMPTALSPEFMSMFSVPAVDLRLHWRRMLPRPTQGDEPQPGTPFPLRAADFDWLSHLNNAAYWYVLEDYLEEEHRELLDGEYEAVLEYNAPITRGEQVEVLTTVGPGSLHLWFLVQGRMRAAARVRSVTPTSTARSSTYSPARAGRST